MLIANFTGPGEEIEIENELWMYDYGQKLQINGLSLPEAFEVHFAWKGLEEAKVQTGSTVDGVSAVDIPNEALAQKSAVKAYIYISAPEEGETTNLVTMYVNRRLRPEGLDAPEDTDLFHHTLAAVAQYQRLAETARDESESWAHGHRNYPEQNENNARYYALQAQKKLEEISEKMNGAGPGSSVQLPDNIVLFEETEEEESVSDIETLIEEKIKENLTMEADGEFLYLLYAETELAKVPMSSIETVPCTGVVINESDMTIDINSDRTYTFTASVSPSDCTQILKWSSSDVSVATVSSAGVLKIIGEGSTVITARCGGYMDTVNIKVSNTKIAFNISKGYSWFSSEGNAMLVDNPARAYIYAGEMVPMPGVADSAYKYGISLKKGAVIKAGLDPETAPNCYYGVQIYDADARERIVDAGWKEAGTEYGYTVEKDNLYLYINLKTGSAGTAAITDEILTRLKTALSVNMEV